MTCQVNITIQPVDANWHVSFSNRWHRCYVLAANSASAWHLNYADGDATINVVISRIHRPRGPA